MAIQITLTESGPELYNIVVGELYNGLELTNYKLSIGIPGVVWMSKFTGR